MRREVEFSSNGRGPVLLRFKVLSEAGLNEDDSKLAPPKEPDSETGDASPLWLIGEATNMLSLTGRKNAGRGGGE